MPEGCRNWQGTAAMRPFRLVAANDAKHAVALLAEHGIDTVVDIRELPLSRKPGFSKKALAGGNSLLAKCSTYFWPPVIGLPSASAMSCSALRNSRNASGDMVSKR